MAARIMRSFSKPVMKKLAIFAEALTGGGVEKTLQTMLKHWDYANIDVTLYSIRNVPLPDSLSGLPIKHRFIFGNPSGSKVSRIRVWLRNKLRLLIYYHCPPKTFYRLFIQQHFDAALAFIEGYATRIVSGAPSSVKRLAWLHCDIINHHWTSIAYRSDQEEIESYHTFDSVVCVSSGVQAQLLKLCGEDLRTRVILNPIDRDDIIRKANVASVPIDVIPAAAIRIISFGRLVPIKGYERLLRVARRLMNDGSDFSLTILGEGSERNRLQALINENNLSTRVFLLGYKENPYPFLKASNIYVCSSYSEGYNTAIVEALVLGKAVVSTDCMKDKDLLGNSEFGIVVDNSEEGLYSGLKQMLQPGLLENYSSIAKERGALFDVKNSMKEVSSLINDFLSV